MVHSPSSILITGGAGFIGSEFVRQWIAEETAPLVNLDKLTYAGHLASLESVEGEPRHIFVEGDICDQALVARLLDEHRPSAIVHFAAESHVDRSIDEPPAFFKTNVLGTCSLLEAVRDYWETLPSEEREAFRFVHISTDEVFGSALPDQVFSETTPYAPNSPYAASKAAADHFVRAYHRTYGLPAIVTNCSNNYGPYQFPEKLIPLMTLHAVAGRAMPVYGDGQQVRDWLHVEDHVRAIRLVLNKGTPGEVYLMGAHCQRTNLEVVETIAGIIDELQPNLPHGPCSSLITFVEDRPGHDRRYAIDASKIERELGWRPTHDFESGLRQTIGWYLDNLQWVEQVSGQLDVGRRLGLGENA